MLFLVVAGARPNFIKVAPILEAFASRRCVHNGFEVRLVHTGQHYDRAMSDDFFRDLGIPEPDVNLGVGSGSHAEQTARVMVGFEKVCAEYRPDWVIVVGDVNSTMACAIAAKKLGIRVAHVEAGLRSGDMSMPEEINRVCTDPISDLLFVTDRIAADNLRREGVDVNRVHFVGNTMIDTLQRNLQRALCTSLPEGLEVHQYGVVTIHRPANVDSPVKLAAICESLLEIAEMLPLVFPVHPRTKAQLSAAGLLHKLLDAPVRLIEPLSYLPFLGLVARSKLVLTDSGGIQEETTILGVPCVTVRPNTERPITCIEGTNVLTGTAPAEIKEAVIVALDRKSKGQHSIPEKWDGRAAERIVDTLLRAGNSALCGTA